MTAAQPGEAQGFTIDEGTHTIRFERRVAADRARVFEAWTDAEQVAEWWDPDGERLVTCDIDLRVGGSFSFATRQHSAMPFAGTYREITPPERLVFESMGATGRVTLQDVGGATRMTVEIVCQSAAQLEQFASMGIAAGTARTVDNLVVFVQRASSLRT
ncbi:MAG: SRPBCC domain-containing protein [Gemmatimonadaceae bacterium]